MTESKKTGLQTGDTRATFIVDKERWERLKDFQNTSKYKSMKELMADMIESFLAENSTK